MRELGGTTDIVTVYTDGTPVYQVVISSTQGKKCPERGVILGSFFAYQNADISFLPVGHVGLAPEDEEHVYPAGPGTDGPPVLLHPDPDHGVLEVLRNMSGVRLGLS